MLKMQQLVFFYLLLEHITWEIQLYYVPENLFGKLQSGLVWSVYMALLSVFL